MPKNLGILFKDDEGEWRFRVTDSQNGQVIAQSEGYVHRIDAVLALERMGVAPDDIEDLEEA